MNTALSLIKKLQLQPHPEGGYYKETYRTSEEITVKDGRIRNIGTVIYYLLENKNVSHFHRLDSDEMWFFHQGNPLEIVTIKDGIFERYILGNDIEKGEIPQLLLPAQTWFAAGLKDEEGYALVSCSVHPGFVFHDFEMGKRTDLLAQFPNLTEVITKYSAE